MSKITTDHHCIESGESSAGPGNSFKWSTYIKYLGNGNWNLQSISKTDGKEDFIMDMNGKELVSWALNADALIDPEFINEDDEYCPLIYKIKNIVDKYDDQICKAIIGWATKTSNEKPEIVEVKEASTREVTTHEKPGKWGAPKFSTSKPGYIVATNYGDCFIWHPKGNKTTLFYKLDSENEFNWEIKLTESQIKSIKGVL